MIVELVGLPGVGKTYLTRAVHERLRQVDSLCLHVAPQVPCSRIEMLRLVPQKLRSAGLFALRYPRLTTRLVGHIRTGGSVLRLRRIRKLVNLCAELLIADRVDDHVLRLCEQGVLQAVWSLEMISERSVQAALLPEIVDWLPDRVVYVQTGRLQIEKQLRDRVFGRSHFDRLDDRALRLAMDKGEARMRRILETRERLMPGSALLVLQNVPGGDRRLAAWIVDPGSDARD